MEPRSRIARVWDIHGRDVVAELVRREGHLLEASGSDARTFALDAFLSADPTRKKIYFQWMATRYLDRDNPDRLRVEDFPRLRATLSLFDRCKHLLPVSDRDIGRYRSEQSLFLTIAHLDRDADEDLIGLGQGKRQKFIERRNALTESEIVWNSDGWICAVPLTWEAARWWGKGARWCTSMDSRRDMYDRYCRTGSLFVLVDPEGGKVQISFAANEFRDSVDSDLDGTFFHRLPGGLGRRLFERVLSDPRDRKGLSLSARRIPASWFAAVGHPHLGSLLSVDLGSVTAEVLDAMIAPYSGDLRLAVADIAPVVAYRMSADPEERRASAAGFLASDEKDFPLHLVDGCDIGTNPAERTRLLLDYVESRDRALPARLMEADADWPRIFGSMTAAIPTLLPDVPPNLMRSAVEFAMGRWITALATRNHPEWLRRDVARMLDAVDWNEEAVSAASGVLAHHGFEPVSRHPSPGL
jgi:hypothetical protein